MSGYKVLVTPRSFGRGDPAVFDLLTDAGVTVVRNDTGAMLSVEGMQERIRDCAGVIVGVDPLDDAVMAAAPGLRAIAKYGIGMDNIDLEAAKRRGIAVSKTVGANSDAVADYTFALLLALARQVTVIDARCKRHNWGTLLSSDVHGKTLGLLGFGAIGKRVAQRARGFSMQVLAYDVVWDAAWSSEYGVQFAEPDKIFREADFVSLHMPLLPATRGFVSKDCLDSMKPTAFLINTARGELVDEDALLSALRARSIAGAGIDAFREEPPQNPEWYALENVILSSHCASSTPDSTRNMGRFAVQNLLKDLGL